MMDDTTSAAIKADILALGAMPMGELYAEDSRRLRIASKFNRDHFGRDRKPNLLPEHQNEFDRVNTAIGRANSIHRLREAFGGWHLGFANGAAISFGSAEEEGEMLGRVDGAVVRKSPVHFLDQQESRAYATHLEAHDGKAFCGTKSPIPGALKITGDTNQITCRICLHHIAAMGATE